MHKYHNNLDIPDDNISVPGTTDKDGKSKRLKRFEKERKKNGFDSRETWSLDMTSAMWLYEHLKMYLEEAGKNVNLSYFKFPVRAIEVDPKIWNVTSLSGIDEHIRLRDPEDMTKEEAIRLCAKYLKSYIATDKNQEKAAEEHTNVNLYVCIIAEMIDLRKAQQAFRIYADLFPAMWW